MLLPPFGALHTSLMQRATNFHSTFANNFMARSLFCSAYGPNLAKWAADKLSAWPATNSHRQPPPSSGNSQHLLPFLLCWFGFCWCFCCCWWRVNKYNIVDCTICTTRVYLYCIYISCWAAAHGGWLLAPGSCPVAPGSPRWPCGNRKNILRSLRKWEKYFQLGDGACTGVCSPLMACNFNAEYYL